MIKNNNTLRGETTPTLLPATAPGSPNTNDLFQPDNKLDNRPMAIDLKGSVFTLPVLCLKVTDLIKIENDLKERLSKSPQFFKNAPIVVDLGSIKERADEFNFLKFATLLRNLHLVPVGVQHGTKIQHESAKWAGFAELKGGTIQALPTATSLDKNTISGTSTPAETTKNNPQATQQNNEQTQSMAGTSSSETTPETMSETTSDTLPKNKASTYSIKSIESAPATRIIRQTVRSGQRIYHQGGDLVLLAAVNAGAEVIADGNIHVYAPLRGRALAGGRGNTEAGIFCLHMEAELIAIAGQYRVFENKVPAEMLGKSVQIFLEGEKIIIASLE